METLDESRRLEFDMELDTKCRSQLFSDFIESSKIRFPLDVKYDATLPLDKKGVTSLFNPKHPLTIHSRHRLRQFRGNCCKVDKEIQQIVTDAKREIIIPENYQGRID